MKRSHIQLRDSLSTFFPYKDATYIFLRQLRCRRCHSNIVETKVCEKCYVAIYCNSSCQKYDLIDHQFDCQVVQNLDLRFEADVEVSTIPPSDSEWPGVLLQVKQLIQEKHIHPNHIFLQGSAKWRSSLSFSRFGYYLLHAKTSFYLLKSFLNYGLSPQLTFEFPSKLEFSVEIMELLHEYGDLYCHAGAPDLYQNLPLFAWMFEKNQRKQNVQDGSLITLSTEMNMEQLRWLFLKCPKIELSGNWNQKLHNARGISKNTKMTAWLLQHHQYVLKEFRIVMIRDLANLCWDYLTADGIPNWPMSNTLKDNNFG